MHAAIEKHWRRLATENRINNALTYFQHAWRAHHVDQACISLSVALELLFAPHDQAETTHQIAHNVSRFLGADAAERERLYDQTRSFYRVRSALVHGGRPEYDTIEASVIFMFKLIAAALRKILLTPRLSEVFQNDKSRRRLFRSFLFE